MSQYIIHKDGVYNIYSTVIDAPFYKGGLSLEQLECVIKQYDGISGLDALPKRLERAHSYGTSAIHEASLESTIASNRAGKGELHLSNDVFIEKFLSGNDIIEDASR